MKQERIYVIALIAVAILASIPQIPVGSNIWGLILVVIGIVGGVMVNYPDVTQRILVYVVAATLAMFANALDFVPGIGEWLHSVFDHMSTGLQGMALGLVCMGLLARVKG